MGIECPYCGMETLKSIYGPTEVYFDSDLEQDELNKVDWQTYECETCGRSVILDDGELQ